MTRLTGAAIVGLLAVTVAWADLIPPGTRNIPVEHRIDTEKDNPNWAFFTIRGSGEVKAVKFDAKTPVVIPGNAAIGNGPVPQPGEKRTRPYRSTVLVAVPAEAARAYPSEKELLAAVGEGKITGAVESKPLGDHENVKTNDPRKKVSNRFLLDKIDAKEGIVLQPVKDEPKPEEDESVAAGPAHVTRWVAMGLAQSAAVGFAGLWFLRRRNDNPRG
jgi:hypothetical protein